jgi:hypothetical protein
MTETISLALRAARQFIINGVEFGYIKMPSDFSDTAHDVLPAIDKAIAELAQRTPPPQTEEREREMIDFRAVLSIEGEGPFYVTLHDDDETLSVVAFDTLGEAEAQHDLLADTLNRIVRAQPTPSGRKK